MACEMQKASPDDCKETQKKLEKLHASAAAAVAAARFSCSSVRLSSRLEILTAAPLANMQEKVEDFPRGNGLEQINRGLSYKNEKNHNNKATVHMLNTQLEFLSSQKTAVRQEGKAFGSHSFIPFDRRNISDEQMPIEQMPISKVLNGAQQEGNLILQQLKMESWSVEQVCNWLKQRNLGELVPKFREEEVSGAALLALNDRMVQQLVKKIGHQAVLMDLIKKYQQQKSGLESFTYCCETASQKFPEVISGAADRQMLNSSGPVEQRKYLCSAENEKGLIDHRVLKQKKNQKSFFARHKTLQWTSSYALPDFPYDVKCILAEKKCPDHSMRIRIIEFLQADMTKYLEGSLYPNSQQYNIVVNALLQAYPFLDEDGNGFLLWKRALKDRFKYVRRPIEDDEQVLRNKCKFGHRRGQRRKSSFAENKLDDVQGQVEEKPAHLKGSAMDLHIKWLNQEYMKTQRNWEEVDNRMNVTIEIRRKMISDKTPLKDILRLFPFLRCPYQLFREFQLLTHMDIYKKTVEILEIYSENILSLYVVRNNPINIMLQENLKQHTEEDVLKYMKMTAACLLLPEVFGDDSSLFAAVNEEVKAVTPVLEVKNPFNVSSCEFALYIEREELAQLDDCTMALAALLAAFHVFDIPCPKRIHRTLNFLESLVFEVRNPASLPTPVKTGLEAPKNPVSDGATSNPHRNI